MSFLAEGSCFKTFCQVNTPIDHDQAPMVSAAPEEVLQKMPAFGDCGLFSVLRVAMPDIFKDMTLEPTALQARFSHDVFEAGSGGGRGGG